MKKISHSAWKKYMTCPRSYNLHYNERLRPDAVSSNLLFGSAIDEALNRALLQTQDPVHAFQELFTLDYVKDVTWEQGDLDLEIMNGAQLRKISGESDHYKTWASMRIKGRMMIDAYMAEIYPQIQEVQKVQFALPNRPGVIDAIVKINDNVTILDNKTAKRPYDLNSAASDTQLNLYAAEMYISHVAFGVMVKTVAKNRKKICKKCGFNGSHVMHKTCPETIDNKRCHGVWDQTLSPQITTQLIIAETDKNVTNLVKSGVTDCEKAIHNDIYPANVGACGKIYGKPCVYIDYCWKKQLNGLSIKPKEDK